MRGEEFTRIPISSFLWGQHKWQMRSGGGWRERAWKILTESVKVKEPDDYGPSSFAYTLAPRTVREMTHCSEGSFLPIT